MTCVFGMAEQKEPTIHLDRDLKRNLKKMNLSILRNIVEFVKYVGVHSIIMVDETSDISSKKQAVFCVCWAYENFLGLHGMEKGDIISIAGFIKVIILLPGFDGKKLRGPYYDSCTIWCSDGKWLATQIKSNIQVLVLSTHYHANSLNLACSNRVRNTALVSKSLEASFKITKLVIFSPKRDLHLWRIHEVKQSNSKVYWFYI